MEPVWQRQPGRGRYAQPERERRFLLRSLPHGAADPLEIEDRYISRTRLRLRRLSDGRGAATYKLTQKVPDGADPSLCFTTNTYLSPEEYEALLVLPASVVRKVRYRIPSAAPASVDEFHGALAGLVLAEVAVGEVPASPPGLPFAAVDVTHDRRFTGGELARTSREDLRRLLDGMGAPQVD
jgi:CYTH domain-containing protein